MKTYTTKYCSRTIGLIIDSILRQHEPATRESTMRETNETEAPTGPRKARLIRTPFGYEIRGYCRGRILRSHFTNWREAIAWEKAGPPASPSKRPKSADT